MHSWALANRKGCFSTIFSLFIRVVLNQHSGKKNYNVALDILKGVDIYRPIWTAPFYVYPISMHFGTFQLELIGDCYPLHILHLSPALYRLTEVALIIFTLPTNSTVGCLVQGHVMLLHLRLLLLMHGLFSITFVLFCFFLFCTLPLSFFYCMD